MGETTSEERQEMTRIPNRTAHIKPATREALMDQLAAIADGIIHVRITSEMAMTVMQARLRPPRVWWHRFAWWRK